MRDQAANIPQPLVVMALAAGVGKLYSTFWRVAAEPRDVPEYSALGAYVISNSTPVAVTFDQMLSAEEAEHIVGLVQPRMQPGHVLEQKQWLMPGLPAPPGALHKARTSGRTNSVGFLTHNETPVVQAIVDRISNVVGIPSTHAEALHVIRYMDGQECAITRRSYHAVWGWINGGRFLSLNPSLTSATLLFACMQIKITWTVTPIPPRIKLGSVW